MLGSKGGTAVKLEKELGRPLAKLWCGAHRLEICLKSSFEGPKRPKPKQYAGVPGHAEFEKLINSIHSFYGGQNHKKILHLKDFEGTRHEKHLKFKKIFRVRWAPSVLDATARIMDKYDTLLSHLDMVANDADEWSPKQREKAEELYKTLTDQNFMLMLNFQLDVLAGMSTQSLMFQKSASSIIGEQGRQRLYSMKLKALQNGESVNLDDFLKSSKCTNDAQLFERYLDTNDDSIIGNCDTLDNYESSQFKSYLGYTLGDHNSEFKPLSTYLKTYTDHLVKDHEKMLLIGF